VALEAEIERGWALLELDVPALEGGVAMKFVVENDTESTIVVVPEPEVINDPDLKSAVAQKVRKLVREMDAHTVYHISDAWTGHVPDAKNRPELMRLVQEIGIKKASEMGLATVREALMCQITKRNEAALLRWFYRREGREEKIVMEERDKINGLAQGRFSKLFT
jgi:hypothetical protein